MFINHDQATNCFQSHKMIIVNLEVIIKKIVLKKKVILYLIKHQD
jgi:hypothetical protein